MKISIVTPCFNEEENIKICSERVADVMKYKLPEYEYEHIFCDNASTDKSRNILRSLAKSNPSVKVILNSRNIGPLRNIANGVKHTNGDLIIPMVPADLQDPPEYIPELVSKMSEEIDIVFGVRQKRKENFALKMARNAYYKIINLYGDKNLPPAHAGEFLLARRAIIKSIIPLLDSSPYVRGLVAKVSDRTTSVSYPWGDRENGKSKNSLGSLIDQALTGIITTAKTPIRSALLLGIILSLVGIIAGLINLFVFIFSSTGAEPGVPTLIVGMFMFGGIQLFFIGLIGEYIVGIHTEVTPKTSDFIIEKINF